MKPGYGARFERIIHEEFFSEASAAILMRQMFSGVPPSSFYTFPLYNSLYPIPPEA